MKKLHIFIIVTVFAGFLLALQIRSFKKVESFIQRSQTANIFAELRVFQVANSELRNVLEDEKKSFTEINSQVANKTIDDEITRLEILAGTKDIAGEGIILTLSSVVKEFWISDLIAQLVSAGAEAIAINDIRLVSATAGLRTVGEGLVMRSHFLKPPLRLTAIGPKLQLRQSIAQNNGIIDRIERAYPALKILITEQDKIILPALGNL